MIEKILCFLVLIICLVYGLALLSWFVMKLDIEKRRIKMAITRKCDKCGKEINPYGDYAQVRVSFPGRHTNTMTGPYPWDYDLCQECADKTIAWINKKEASHD